MNILESLQNLYFYRLDIRFYPNGPIRLPHWTGAVIRNRFLYAAEQIHDNHGHSLRELLDTFPLSEEHAYYKQLVGGFPKGFLFDCTTLPFQYGNLVLEEEHIYAFSLLLIGNCSDYYPLFIAALKRMFSEGFGKPMTSLTLIDICERKDILLCSGKESFLNKPSAPFTLEGFILPFENNTKITLHFKTPVSLANHAQKENQVNGYQNKLNNFPSFYQFMRSLLYRLVTLNMLYVNSDNIATPAEIKESIEQFITPAGRALLLNANINYEKRYSTPRVGETNVYTMSGYCGTLSFNQVNSRFIPLLQFASHLGIGNDINYGLGIFDVHIDN